MEPYTTTNSELARWIHDLMPSEYIGCFIVGYDGNGNKKCEYRFNDVGEEIIIIRERYDLEKGWSDDERRKAKAQPKVQQ